MEKKNCPNMEIFSGPYFPVFGLITKIFSVNLQIQSENGKMRTRQKSIWDTSQEVFPVSKLCGKKTLSSHLEKSIIEFFQWVILLEELSSRCSTEGLLTKFGMKTFVVDYTFRKQIHMVNKGPLTNGLDQG